MERKKIVILDGHAANPGDLSWDAIRALGDCTVYERCESEAEILERARDAEILLINKPAITRSVMQRLPKLKYIAVQATGYNVVDIAAAEELGIKVSNVPAYSRDSVAQFTFALILELMNHAGLHADAVADGKWCSSKDFTFFLRQSHELAGLTFGIIGFGSIGSAAAKIADAFGMKVLAYSRTPKISDAVTFTDLDGVFSNSDIVSLHCPLTDATKEIVNEGNLRRMKRSALLINTARGGLVDEAALACALNEGRIAGAGLDVLSTEPPTEDNPLLHARNCVITPHIAWATQEARSRLLKVSEANVKAYLAGTPINLVTKH